MRESRLTAKVTHPAVMTVYDVGRAGDVVFIAMELIRGETSILVTGYGADHPQVASALVTRGTMHCAMRDHHACVADLEHAAELFAKHEIETGYLASAQWALARELWPTDRRRARELCASAKQRFATSSPMWKDLQADLDDWIATDGRPRHPPRRW